MLNKIIIHTDASNINNSGKCKISSIINFNGNCYSIVTDYIGKINEAELFIVLETLLQIEKNYSPVNFIINVYSDHAANVKFLNSIINKAYQESPRTIDKLYKALKRKNLSMQDLEVIERLQNKNTLKINWIPRKENKEADKLTKHH